MSHKVEVLEMVTMMTSAVRRAHSAIQTIPGDVAMATRAWRQIEAVPELKEEFEHIMADLSDYDIDTFKKELDVIQKAVRFEPAATEKEPVPEDSTPEPAQDVESPGEVEPNRVWK